MFLLYTKLKAIKILKLSSRLLVFTSYQAFFKKNKKRSKTSFHAIFSRWFLKKNIFCVIFYQLTKFYFLVAFSSWDNAQHLYCISFLTRLWRHKFFYIIKKLRQKFWYIENKKTFQHEKKEFLIIWKERV